MKFLNTKTYLIQGFRTGTIKPMYVRGKGKLTFVVSLLGLGLFFINYSKSGRIN